MTTTQAFVALMEAHQRGIWRYLRVLGADEALADDITQETFLAAFEKPPEQHSQGQTAAWLRTVAKNLYLKSLRRAAYERSARLAAQADALWETPLCEDGGDPYVAAARKCIDALDERTRRALDLRYADDARRSQVAAVLGLSEHGARNLLQRAKASLRDCIERRMAGKSGGTS